MAPRGEIISAESAEHGYKKYDSVQHLHVSGSVWRSFTDCAHRQCMFLVTVIPYYRPSLYPDFFGIYDQEHPQLLMLLWFRCCLAATRPRPQNVSKCWTRTAFLVASVSAAYLCRIEGPALALNVDAQYTCSPCVYICKKEHGCLSWCM